MSGIVKFLLRLFISCELTQLLPDPVAFHVYIMCRNVRSCVSIWANMYSLNPWGSEAAV